MIPVRTKDFTWQLSLNTSETKNKVNKNQRINTLNDYLEGSAVVDGEAFSTFYSFKYNGLNDENGTPEFAYMDVLNGASPLNYLVKSGKFTPDFSGGLNMMFNIETGHYSRCLTYNGVAMPVYRSCMTRTIIMGSQLRNKMYLGI